MKYEILDDAGNVTNTIVASPDFVEANYHGHYREVAEVVPTVANPAVITKFEFLKRFTSDERKAINFAAKTDLDVEDFKMLLDAAQEVNLEHQDTISGVNSLETAGLLSSGRANEILKP